MAQLVKHLILDFGSGHDLRVMGSSPGLGPVLSRDSACPSSSACPPALRKKRKGKNRKEKKEKALNIERRKEREERKERKKEEKGRKKGGFG